MLFYNTVEPDTLELLKSIQKNSIFKDFFLVGGTALALQMGHRLSVYLDFFSQQAFDRDSMIEILIKQHNTMIISIGENAISGTINNVKVEFIAHQYPLIKPIENLDNIKLASCEDIAAMKINAIRNRGSKKDFIDLYFLLEKFTIKEILEYSDKKYVNFANSLTLKSMLYFEDAEREPMPVLLKELAWDEVKATIKNHVLKIV